MTTTTYFIETGAERPSRMEYSYGRRAQSVVYSLHWRQVAFTSDRSEAVEYARGRDAPPEVRAPLRLAGLVGQGDSGVS